jgi:hypothetical protein
MKIYNSKVLSEMFGLFDISSRLIPRGGKPGSASSSKTRNDRYYEKIKAKNRKRNKIARKSRRINRMKTA